VRAWGGLGGALLLPRRFPMQRKPDSLAQEIAVPSAHHAFSGKHSRFVVNNDR
jgi:hypothetical protein